jgi:hypothetical protein
MRARVSRSSRFMTGLCDHFFLASSIIDELGSRLSEPRCKARLRRFPKTRNKGWRFYRKLTYRSTKMLTHMATFDKIIQEKILLPVVVRLGRNKFPERTLFAYPESLTWMKQTVPTPVTGRQQSAQTPSEQLILRLQQWISGDQIKPGPMFREMSHPPDSDTWELKTDDLRLFGWMYRPKTFIIASHGYADDYKEPTKIRDYADDVRAVVEARSVLPLDEPKLVRGKFDELI